MLKPVCYAILGQSGVWMSESCICGDADVLQAELEYAREEKPSEDYKIVPLYTRPAGKVDGTERIKIPISQPKFGPLLNDAKPAPDEEMVEPPEFHDFCERIFIPGTDYRTGDIRMLLREHIKELREIMARWDAGV